LTSNKHNYIISELSHALIIIKAY